MKIYLYEGDVLERTFNLSNFNLTDEELPSDIVFSFGIEYIKDETYLNTDISYADGVVTVDFSEALFVGYTGNYRYSLKMSSNSDSNYNKTLVQSTIYIVDSIMYNASSFTPENSLMNLDAIIDSLDALDDGKVDKVEGKELSSNDFTDVYQTKLDGIEENANNYDDTEVRSLIANKAHTSLTNLNEDSDNTHIAQELKDLLNAYGIQVLRPQVFKIKCNAGRFDCSWDNSGGRAWQFPEGTVLHSDGVTPIKVSYDAQPDVDIPTGGGIVKLSCSNWQGNYSFKNNNTGVNITGDLSDLPPVSYYLSLAYCSLVTGDLSDLPPVSYFLTLTNCSNITGDLSDLPPVSYYLSLAYCSLVTGDLSDLPPVSYRLDLYNCSNITGDLSDLPPVSNYLDLYNCSNITGGLSDLPPLSYYLNLFNCSNITGDLSDLPPVSYYLSLYNCSLVTGDLSDLPPVSYRLNLAYCSLVTGGLSDLPPLSYYLNLFNCSNITGAYTQVSGNNVPTITDLSNTSMSATDMDSTLIAYAACTKDNGTFAATGRTRTSASDTAVATLTGRGWTISGLTTV